MWWLHDGEREPDQGGGWATANGLLVPAVFALLCVTEAAIGIVLEVVVGVLEAPDAPGDLPGPVVPACDGTPVMTRGTTLTRADNDNG